MVNVCDIVSIDTVYTSISIDNDIVGSTNRVPVTLQFEGSSPV